jgi:hypothetical protein
MLNRRLLLVGNNLERVQLLAHTLRRRFPHAIIPHAAELETASEFLRTQAYDAVILVIADENRAVEMIGGFRRINPAIPLIVVSPVDRSEMVLAAGATGFLRHDEFLRIGQVIENALGARADAGRGENHASRSPSSLREQAESLAKSIAFHEDTRENLLQRRRGATDHVMVELDQRLVVNERTLKTLRRTHQLILFELGSDAGRGDAAGK